jgi:arylsulfatase A-like enzyme
MWQHWRLPILLGLAAAFPVVFSLAWWLFAMEEGETEFEPTQGPKLAVVLVFDQLRGDYLAKWQPLFGEGGLKRLQTEGAWFTNCHYPYSETLTAPGHASLLTGCNPNEHGIIANEWYDRKTHQAVTSVTTDRKAPGPWRRRQPTVGDVLLTHTGKRSKIASLSIKDRSAILLAAFYAQICYWLSGGTFTTSSHYPEGPHRWVTQYNSSKKIHSWLGQPWNRLRPNLAYEKFSGPDDVDFEGNGYDQGRTFPHPTPNVNAVENSPFGNEVLLDLAKTAIDAEKLGQRGVPDLLCLSFSSNDLVGHCYGPDSQEVLDVTLRTDLIIKEILDFLDDRVGKGNYVVALSADHGICPIPAVAQLQGNKEAGYVPPTLLTSETEAFLNKTFAHGEKLKWFDNSELRSHSIYLNQAVLKERNLEPARVEKALADWLVQQPGVEAAFTRTQLNVDQTLDDPLAERARLSFHPDCSGDVVVILKKYHLMMPRPLAQKTKSYATTHGSPHPYDTHVPLLIMGPGIQPGTYDQLVAPQAMAALLSRVLGIPAPKGARYFPPATVYVSGTQ